MSDPKALPHNHGSVSDELLENLPDITQIKTVSEAMKQLGDPLRLQIFWLLCHCEECVTNIAAIVGMSAPAVSHHLRLLKADQLITARRSGKEMYYSACDTPLVAALHKMIEEIVQITCPGSPQS